MNKRPAIGFASAAIQPLSRKVSVARNAERQRGKIMSGLFGELFGLVKDVAETAEAIVSVPVTIVRGATKPIADLAKELKQEVKDAIDD